MFIKIKDDKDLKELEKFGFVYENNDLDGEIYKNCDDDCEQSIYVSIEDRTIWVEDNNVNFLGAIVDKQLGVLYKLIKAGFVELVEEECE